MVKADINGSAASRGENIEFDANARHCRAARARGKGQNRRQQLTNRSAVMVAWGKAGRYPIQGAPACGRVLGGQRRSGNEIGQFAKG